jgi:hypothetical protein
MFSNKAVHKAAHLLEYTLSRQGPSEARDLDSEQSSFVYLCRDHAYQIHQTHIQFVFPSHHNIQLLTRTEINYRTSIYKLQEYSFSILCGPWNYSHIYIIESVIKK